MIEEAATVVRVDGAAAWVAVDRRSACGSCAVRSGCGTGALSSVLGRRRAELRVTAPMTLQPGDQVLLGLQERALLRGSLAVYAVPLLVLIGMSLLGSAIGTAAGGAAADGWALGLGALGTVSALLWVRRFGRRVATDPNYQPVVLRRLGPVQTEQGAREGVSFENFGRRV